MDIQILSQVCWDLQLSSPNEERTTIWFVLNFACQCWESHPTCEQLVTRTGAAYKKQMVRQIGAQEDDRLLLATRKYWNRIIDLYQLVRNELGISIRWIRMLYKKIAFILKKRRIAWLTCVCTTNRSKWKRTGSVVKILNSECARNGITQVLFRTFKPF